MNNIIYKELSIEVIGMAFKVHQELGPGLLESAYEDDDNEKVPLLRIVLFRYRLEFQNIQVSFEEHFETPGNIIAMQYAGIPFQRQQVYPLLYKGDWLTREAGKLGVFSLREKLQETKLK